MDSCKSERTAIFVSPRRPEPAVEQELETRGITVGWAACINMLPGLMDPRRGIMTIVTELALPDGNWRDVVERITAFGRPIPILLVAPASTAELWWDALECGVLDILVTPLSASKLGHYVAAAFGVVEPHP
jgi:DNA-binding NtrC family response regulator